MLTKEDNLTGSGVFWVQALCVPTNFTPRFVSNLWPVTSVPHTDRAIVWKRKKSVVKIYRIIWGAIHQLLNIIF
jgi:hypothetical protein